MEIVSGSITSPSGFKSSGIHCGIKRKRPDLGLLYSEVPAKVAALFTTNKLPGAHISIDKEHLKKGNIQAILVNSGNANCYTGRQGLKDTRYLIEVVANKLGIDKDRVLMASTGIIGKPLPVDLIKKNIGKLVKRLNKKDKKDFAQSILTTDKVIKQKVARFSLGKKRIVVAACIKGAGMIHPHMATTLCFVTTDAFIHKKALKYALKEAVDKTLNLISVEGEMSPNDTVIALANGLAKNKPITVDSKGYFKFIKALTSVLSILSKMLIKDAEGASKLIRVNIEGAESYKDAKRLAFSIANSNLVKTACYGEDPNWGRVVSCIGSSGIRLSPKKLEVSFDNITVFKGLEPKRHNKAKLQKIFKKKEIDITVRLHMGKYQVSVLTSDLTPEYIRINAHYRT